MLSSFSLSCSFQLPRDTCLDIYTFQGNKTLKCQWVISHILYSVIAVCSNCASLFPPFSPMLFSPRFITSDAVFSSAWGEFLQEEKVHLSYISFPWFCHTLILLNSWVRKSQIMQFGRIHLNTFVKTKFSKD